MKQYTIEEKYEFICSMLKITNISLWEQDGCLEWMEYKGEHNVDSLYFQFDIDSSVGRYDVPQSVDEAIVCAMNTP